MTRCTIHPGREAAKIVFGKPYCSICVREQDAAVQTVRRQNIHVEPKECFIAYDGRRWVPIPGTGCAHYVAHRLNISSGAPWNKCLRGCTIRVSDLVQGRQKVADLKDVQVNDIWAAADLSHNGIVSQVDKDPSGKVTISITHDSSRQGGVRTNDFNVYFHGEGSFYR